MSSAGNNLNTSPKMKALKDYLARLENVMVSFSGGIDSTFLLAVAREVLGDTVLAVTGASCTFPPEELAEAHKLAQCLGVRHIMVNTNELGNPNFSSNPPNRCYHCKKELYACLKKISLAENINYIVDGANADDSSDFRPGAVAAREMGIRSPLQECGFTKKDIRSLAEKMNLPNFNKPAQPCLSSRVPYNSPITAAKIRQVHLAEQFLKEKGFKYIRVRHHNTIARIEIPFDLINKITGMPWLPEMVVYFKTLGFNYVTLDLEGMRSGSLNEVLSEEEKFEPRGLA